MSTKSLDRAGTVRSGFGWRFRAVLLLSIALVAACVFIIPPSPHSEVAFIGASAFALIVVITATVRFILSPALRSMGSLVLSVLAGIAAVPALLLMIFAIFMILPVMPWEQNAIASAELFVERHGYTAAGHPDNLPVLQNDIMEIGSADEIIESRRNTLRPHAAGIVGMPVLGYSVLFEYTRPPHRVAGMPRSLFVVRVERDGRVRRPHMMPVYPDWLFKENER